MNLRHFACVLPASLLLSACGTTFPWQGSSSLREPERSRMATQFANSAKIAYRCDKVDALTSRVVTTQPAATGQGPLASEGSRVTERWSLALCGRLVEAEVHHSLDQAGHPVAVLRPL